MAELHALAKILARLASMTQAFVFQHLGSLEAEDAETYEGMTFPHYRPVLRLAGTDPSVIAIGAIHGVERMGLILGRIEADGRTASALSVYVVPNHRGNGIATALLTQLEQHLEVRGCARLDAVYTSGLPATPIVERLLRNRGFGPTTTRTVITRFTPDIVNAPWMAHHQLPSGATFVSWSDLTDDDRESIRARQDEDPWIPSELSPFDWEDGFEPWSSIAVRYRGVIEGWLITHALSSGSLRLSCGWARRQLQRVGRTVPAIAVLHETLRRAIDAGFQSFIWLSSVQQPRMLGFTQRRVAPYALSCRETRGTRKYLGAAPRVLCPADIDFADPDIFAPGRARAAWRRLRADAPVAWHEGTTSFPGFWSIARYKDIVAVCQEPATFTSGHGFTMDADPANPSPLVAPGKMLLSMDPPRHTHARRLVSEALTARGGAALEPVIRAAAAEVVDDFVHRRNGDFVTDVAARLPLTVICRLLSVPRDDERRIGELTERILGFADAERHAAGNRSLAAVRWQHELLDYFARLLEARRYAPGDDPISRLLHAEDNGERLSEEEILYTGYLLMLAGYGITRDAIAGGMLALLEHRQQRQDLAGNRGLMTTAVEELLRWTSPVLHVARTAVRDVELRGQRMRTGEKLVLWLASANYDETVFAEPDRFDLRRTPNNHLAFGTGEHASLGADLARLELRVLLEELLPYLPQIELAGPVQRRRSAFLAGIREMPVRFLDEC